MSENFRVAAIKGVFKPSMVTTDIYVVQVTKGYKQAQTLKAIREAESYSGPSVVIAYVPAWSTALRQA